MKRPARSIPGGTFHVEQPRSLRERGELKRAVPRLRVHWLRVPRLPVRTPVVHVIG